MKQAVILNIVFFLLLQNTFLAFSDGTGSLTPEEKTELRIVLESIEKESDMNFIYSDNLIRGKFVESFPLNDFSPKTVEEFLNRAGLSYKVFSAGTYVLYEKIIEQKKVKLHEKVITNEEFIQKDSSDVIQKPLLLTQPAPQYPLEAVAQQLEGRVKIKFKIDTKGNVIKSYVLETSGEKVLDSISKDYVFNLKYTPARINGRKHDVWVTMIFDYVLSDSVYKK